MTSYRLDETWHRLREWTNASPSSERLAAQLLLADGFTSVDPSHPLGGPDGGLDHLCEREGVRYAAAVWFPRGEKPFAAAKKKMESDLVAARANSEVEAFVFITNQELRRAERKVLEDTWPDRVRLLHLERIAALLDQPAMHEVRRIYLRIEIDASPGRGGTGGDAAAEGQRAVAVAGDGGQGRGGCGDGGDGGRATSRGDDSLALGGDGGDGGDSGGADGRGAGGGRTALESGLTWVGTESWSAGLGGGGGNDPEYDRRLNIMVGIHDHYRSVFVHRWVFVQAGIDRVPLVFVNTRLRELGESWQVELGLEGFVLPPLQA